MQGYHVQVTGRSDGDLTPEGIVQKVADSSGSKYSSATDPPPVISAPKPSVASKPVFTPARTGGGGGGPGLPMNTSRPGLVNRSSNVDDDGWGPDAPPVARTQLEKVEPAYKPTRVDMSNLVKGKQETTAAFGAKNHESDDVVKGGYQPVGKVDIASIRQQAREAGGLKDDRPEPVKGSYEPVGKVDIGAIRSRMQKPSDTPSESSRSPAAPQPPSAEPTDSARLTSLPKPKVSNKVGAGPAFAATKPPIPTDPASKPPAAAAPVGAANRNFAEEGGKTPAQIWAERKAKAQGGSVPASSEPPVVNQHSGDSQWRSSYTGKSWAPVQIAHTGKSAASNASEQATTDAAANERSEVESEAPRADINSIRNQFAHAPPPVHAPTTGRTVPIPALPSGPTEPEIGYEPRTHQNIPSPPPQVRSPSPPAPPVRESSPIQIAAPVGRGVADAHDEQYAPPPAMPEESLRRAVPEPESLEDDSNDIGRAAAETTVGSGGLQAGGIQALVQYDYEKSEDNEVDLKEGEYVTDIEMVDQDWWLGVNVHGEHGLFPSNYVEIVEDAPQNEPPSTAQDPEIEEHAPPASPPAEQFDPPSHGAEKGPTAAALYDYEAAEDNELSFPEGAEIAGIVSIYLLFPTRASRIICPNITYTPRRRRFVANYAL